MNYRLTIGDQAKKDIQSLDGVNQKRIAKKLKYFISQENPLVYAKKLIDYRGGEYRWRVGHFRLIFDIDGKNIKLLRNQHRGDVYRK